MKFISRIPDYLWFLGLMVALASFYNYQSILFKRPQSVHHWRQADCASLALMYYQNGMKFFEPQTHNLTSEGGKTGYVAPSEVPILYYSVALLYKVFGYHDYVFRIFNTLIFFLGLFYLFRLYKLASRSAFWGIACALLFFTSPVLAYYGNNFLSNTGVLSFSIVGWYFFFRYRETTKTKFFYLCLAFFCLACSFKISAGFSLFALMAVFVMEKVPFIYISQSRIFPKGIIPWLGFVLAFSIPLSWILYAHQYNLKHETGYFSTGTFPLWTLDSHYIQYVKHNVWNLWRTEYFSNPALMFFLGVLLLQLVLIFKNQRLFNLILLLMLAEVAVYILLQFMTFGDHDYYTIDIYIVLIFSLLSTLGVILKIRPSLLNNKAIKILFTLFLAFNAWHCHNKMQVRYEGWWNEYPAYKDFHIIKPYLRQLGIAPQDTIITIPEASHFIHYLTNQQGWTRYADSADNHQSPELYRDDSLFIEQCLKNGAHYLLVLDSGRTLNCLPAFRKIAKCPIGSFNRVTIYSLRENFKSKLVPPREVLTEVNWNANSTFPFIKGSRKNEVITKSPQKNNEDSLELTEEEPFGFNLTIKNVSLGEEYIATVLCKGKHGLLVSQATQTRVFYLTSDNKQNSSGFNGWDTLHLQFYVQDKLPGRKLKFYVWKSGKESTCFKDMRIIRKDGIKEEDIL